MKNQGFFYIGFFLLTFFPNFSFAQSVYSANKDKAQLERIISVLGQSEDRVVDILGKTDEAYIQRPGKGKDQYLSTMTYPSKGFYLLFQKGENGKRNVHRIILHTQKKKRALNGNKVVIKAYSYALSPPELKDWFGEFPDLKGIFSDEHKYVHPKFTIEFDTKDYHQFGSPRENIVIESTVLTEDQKQGIVQQKIADEDFELCLKNTKGKESIAGDTYVFKGRKKSATEGWISGYEIILSDHNLLFKKNNKALGKSISIDIIEDKLQEDHIRRVHCKVLENGKETDRSLVIIDLTQLPEETFKKLKQKNYFIFFFGKENAMVQFYMDIESK